MPTPDNDSAPTEDEILRAYDTLFADGVGVKRFARSGLRHVSLGHDAVLVEQNPTKTSEWAKASRDGKRIAWVMRDGEYLARVVDGEVTFLK